MFKLYLLALVCGTAVIGTRRPVPGCNFHEGNPIWKFTLDLGDKPSIRECVKACEDKKLYYPDINGVTVSRTNKKCYCTRRMTSLVPSSGWRTCLTTTVDGGLSVWSDWSVCSASCGGGVQERRRNCNNPLPQNGGKQCNGTMMQKKDCNWRNCPSVTCCFFPGWVIKKNYIDIGVKSTISECILACEDRKANDPDINGVAITTSSTIICRCIRGMTGWLPNSSWKSCVTEPVAGGFSAWSDWSMCSATCNGGTQHRRRLCDNPSPLAGGRDCQGVRSETQACNNRPCPRWSCTPVEGEGITGSYVELGIMRSEVDCISTCKELKFLKVPSINGAYISNISYTILKCSCAKGTAIVKNLNGVRSCVFK